MFPLKNLFAKQLCLLFLTPLFYLSIHATTPEWWSLSNIDPDDDPFAPVNVGQLKYVANKAKEHLEAQGFSPCVQLNQHVPFTASEDDYAPVNVGQLKFVASLFYDCFGKAYPWDTNSPPEDDYAIANIGQLRYVFNFEVEDTGLPPSTQMGDAMWVWPQTAVGNNEGNEGALFNQQERDTLIDFCLSHNINVVYFFAGLLNNNRVVNGRSEVSHWETLLEQFHAAKIEVEALVGHANWLMPAGEWPTTGSRPRPNEDRATGLGQVDALLTYQTNHQNNPNQAFDGIHFDIEMGEMSDDTERDEITIAEQIPWFLEWIETIKDRRQNSGLSELSLPFSWSIGMDYDAREAEDGVLPFTYPSVVDGMPITKPGWQHIFDRLEKIIFLTYSDRARYISARMVAELQYLQEDYPLAPPPIKYAFEFQELRNPNTQVKTGIDLAIEDEVAYVNLRQNLHSVLRASSLSPLFDGFGLHAYNSADNLGSFPQWLIKNQPLKYPRATPFKKRGRIIAIPDDGSAFSEPVHLKLLLKAHPDYMYKDNDFRNMISILPIGHGYADEADLFAMNKINNDCTVNPIRFYDGIAPKNSWYYGKGTKVRWWPNPVRNDETRELQNNGVCWINPATPANAQRGVVRTLKLERGNSYRFVLAYNRASGIEEFLSKTIEADYGPNGEGQSESNPLGMTLYLGQIPDIDIDTAVHSNDSIIIYDSDHDGLTDGEEIINGTDPFTP